jgi:hypothetical protein
VASEEDRVSENVGQAVVARVSELLPVLRERAQETEDARVVPAESVKALADTGFFRLLRGWRRCLADLHAHGPLVRPALL